MSILSKDANLSRNNTNHCVRATAIAALSHASFGVCYIRTVSSHRKEVSVQSYVSNTTTTQKRNMSDALSNTTAGLSMVNKDIADFNDEMDDLLFLSLSQTEQMVLNAMFR